MLAMSIHQNGHARLWLWPMGLANPIPITDGSADDRDPAFRPDGGAIAFSSERGGNWDLYVLDLSTGQVENLTNSPEFEGHPSWSPDSRQIVYEHYTNGHFGINIRRVEDRSLMWQGPSGMDSMEPDWSPLARAISFTGRIGTHTDIYVFNLDTQTIIDLTNTPDLDKHDSSFSPDGKSIAYSVEQNGYSWVYTLSTTDPSKKPTLVGQGEAPEWSPDGKWIRKRLSRICSNRICFLRLPPGSPFRRPRYGSRAGWIARPGRRRCYPTRCRPGFSRWLPRNPIPRPQSLPPGLPSRRNW